MDSTQLVAYGYWAVVCNKAILSTLDLQIILADFTSCHKYVLCSFQFKIGQLNPAIHQDQSGLCNWFLCSLSVYLFPVCLSVLCLSVTFFLILLQYNICQTCTLQYKFLRGKVMRREFLATYCCFNILCHKMITSGQILVFEVSIEPY